MSNGRTAQQKILRHRFLAWTQSPLTWRLALLVLASTGMIFAVASWYTDRVARDLLLHEARENTRHRARQAVRHVDSILQSVQPLPGLLANRLAEGPLERAELERLLRAMLQANPTIYGGTAAFEAEKCAPYFYRKEGRLAFSDLAAEHYNYPARDWYTAAKERGRPTWSEPYFDAGGGETWMVTYSVPFHRERNGRREFAGVVTADVQLDHLSGIVSDIKLYGSGYAFLISRRGQYISYPQREVMFRESIFSRAEKTGSQQHQEIGQRMIRGEEGVVRVSSRHLGRMSWLYFAPVPSSGWSVGIQFAEDEVLADLRVMNRTVLVIGAIGFGLLFAAVVFVAARVIEPIRQLAQQTREIAKGNLDLQIPRVNSRDEVGDLTQSFENMRVALKEYIANLAHTSAAKERIESELKIAHTIQRNFLPKRFPPFPDKLQFDLYAHLEAAREVGGDLYDFFLLDDDHLFFSIGDVAGKGVPAALFMAVSKTLIKGVAEQNLSPSQVLEKANCELAQENDELMFVTVCCGVLELSTGRVRYTNAGHLPPLWLRPGREAAWIELPRGLLLGVEPDSRYETRTLTLQPGDTLLLYTDGVTEAMNMRDEFYGEDRLRALATQHTGAAPKELIATITEAVQQFSSVVVSPNDPTISMLAEPTAQSDDITLLALRYRGQGTGQTRQS
ncbi:MAG: HAMP domain-containing protein [Verrucomicrobia bacterium]|nr:HAMP domain-containing protein [Verrucomicrobiota bacterium]